MRRILGCLIFFIIMTTPQIFAGTIYYVDVTYGSDSNPGTESLPWQTIQKAANTMVAGDTVTVYGGTYAERVTETTSGSEGNLITYKVNSGDNVSCQGFVIEGDYIKIDGFTVTANFCAWNAAGIWVEGYNCIIENNYAYNCPKSGIVTRPSSSDCIIRNNQCYLNSNSGMTIQGTNHLVESNEVWGTVAYNVDTGCLGDADGMRFFGSGHIFRGNYIHDISYDDPTNQSYGPHIDAFQTWTAGAGGESAGSDIIFEQNWIDLLTDNGDPHEVGHGWMLKNANNILIINNVVRTFIAVNTGAGGNSNLSFINNIFINDLSSNPSIWPSGIGLDNVTGCVIKNNIFYNIIDDQISISGSSGLEIDYNCAYRSDGVIPISEGAPNAHDLWGINPKFVNVLEDDFHLRSDSPCIDAGTSISEVTDDYEGNSRPQGRGYDIGAYESAYTSTPLSVTINASPSSGYVPLSVNFEGDATGGTKPYSYSWDFGDGESSDEQNPSHTYSGVGEYSITLTVTDSNSNQASDSLIINAYASITPLEASCTASPTSGEIPLTVNFTGNATGGTPPYSYSWNFGDGGSSNKQNPSHSYSEAGDYIVIFTVTDSQSSQASDSVTITASPPPLSVSASASPTSGEVPLTVSFTGSASGGASPYSFNWDFGDGGSSSSQNSSHTYTNASTYSVVFTVTDAQSNQASDSLTITASSIPTYQLAVSAATGSSAPGAGGTTDPSPGNHSYSVGNSVQVEALANENYRFSKWTGDVSDSETYNEEVTITMDKDKSISAFFCTKCGDVTGDLSITPADSQAAFEIFLGIISNPTESEIENADVNCSGSKTEPDITPGDAQAIFEKFLGINELPCDCSCSSRDGSVLTLMQLIPMRQASDVNIIIDDIRVNQGGEVVVPIIVDNPFNIKAFGFDLIFPSEVLEFVGVERRGPLDDFYQVDANMIAEGVVRAGGYRSEAIRSHSPRELITLVFKVMGEGKGEGISSFSIVNTVDDIKNASVKNERVIERVREPRHIRRQDVRIK